MLIIKYLAKKPFQENESKHFAKNDLEAGNNFDSENEQETKPNAETKTEQAMTSLITKAVIENDNQNAQEKSIEKSNIDPNSD